MAELAEERTVLADLRRLLAEATPAPWKAYRNGSINGDFSNPSKCLGLCSTVVEGRIMRQVGQGFEQVISERPGARPRDAALIVALRNHAEALVEIAEAAIELAPLIRDALGGGFVVRPNSEEQVEAFKTSLARLEALEFESASGREEASEPREETNA